MEEKHKGSVYYAYCLNPIESLEEMSIKGSRILAPELLQFTDCIWLVLILCQQQDFNCTSALESLLDLPQLFNVVLISWKTPNVGY